MVAALTLGALLLSGSASLGSPVPLSPGLGSPSFDPRSPTFPRSPLPPMPRSPLPPVEDPRSPMWPRTPLPMSARAEKTNFMVPRELLPRDTDGVTRCGSHFTTDRHAEAEKHFKKNKKSASAKYRTAAEPINVHFHVIYADQSLEGGYVPDEQINAQIDAMNKAYSGTALSFKLVNITRTQNADWFNNVGPDEQQQTDMKTQLRVGNAMDLNVYTVGFKQGSGKGLLGYSTFPVDYEANPEDDAVVIAYGTLPGGSTTNYDQGKTLVHESGHWAGLYHTFQGGCDEPGDEVADTVAEATAATGCPVNRKSCPNSEGLDPITNYMDYTIDSCMDSGFTPGQAQRMADQMRTYRGMAI